MTASTLAPNSARAPACPAAIDDAAELVRRFTLARLPHIETVLAIAVRDLGDPLGDITAAVASGVGVHGRGGRRWRPLLTLAAGEVCGGSPVELAAVAAGVELTHTASLLLDDLPCMDDSAERRGRPAMHRMIGVGPTILVAVGLLARAAQLLARAPRNVETIMAVWGETVGLDGMAGGQIADLTASAERLRSGAIRRLYRKKTTALAAFALSTGARACGASAPFIKGLERFGRGIGWAYQLADDVTDRATDRRPSPADDRRAGMAYRLRRRAEQTLLATPGASEQKLQLLLAFGRVIVPDRHATNDAP